MLTAVANRLRSVPLDYLDQFIMSYGGLRGAVAFALVVLLKQEDFPHRQLFITTTVVVIYFTNLFMVGFRDRVSVNAQTDVWTFDVLKMCPKRPNLSVLSPLAVDYVQNNRSGCKSSFSSLTETLGTLRVEISGFISFGVSIEFGHIFMHF